MCLLGYDEYGTGDNDWELLQYNLHLYTGWLQTVKNKCCHFFFFFFSNFIISYQKRLLKIHKLGNLNKDRKMTWPRPHIGPVEKSETHYQKSDFPTATSVIHYSKQSQIMNCFSQWKLWKLCISFYENINIKYCKMKKCKDIKNVS